MDSVEIAARSVIFARLEMMTTAPAGAEVARERGILLGLRQGDQFVYAAFQFDLTEQRVRPAVAVANKSLNALADPWAIASWWASPSALIATNDCPFELAVNGKDEVLAQLVAAEIESD